MCRGYKTIVLAKNGKVYGKRVNRLVYEAFNGDIPEGMQVNHIDENKCNNALSNLNLMTPKQNSNWGHHRQNISNSKKGKHLSTETIEKINKTRKRKIVYQYTLDGKLVKVWESNKECSRNGFNNVHRCCNGKLYSIKGFIWSYTKKEDIS